MSRDLRVAYIQQLSGDDYASAAGLGFDQQVNLKRDLRDRLCVVFHCSMIECLRGAAVRDYRRASQLGRPVVFALLLSSNPQRTPWRLEPRRLAACSSLRSLLTAAPAAIARLFRSSACTLAPDVLSSFPSLWCSPVGLQ